MRDIKEFIKQEWLLIVAFIFFIISFLIKREIPKIGNFEIEVLLILTSLFIIVKGLERSNFLLLVATKIENCKYISIWLILFTFFIAALFTNDVALVIVVPLTLRLNIKNRALLVVLETIAANGGSILTPFGNPQNLFIYWYYKIDPFTFIKSTALIAILILFFALILSFRIKNCKKGVNLISVRVNRFYFTIFAISFLLVVLVILHILPFYTIYFILFFLFLIDRASFKIDYWLILTFLLFILSANNFKEIFLNIFNTHHSIFLYSILFSQILSNVPTTLLFLKVTLNWKALLWGVNIGGFGSLFASFANLIAYKFYISSKKDDILYFTILFLFLNYIVLFLGMVLYFLLFK